jgi:hypothetical protein
MSRMNVKLLLDDFELEAASAAAIIPMSGASFRLGYVRVVGKGH